MGKIFFILIPLTGFFLGYTIMQQLDNNISAKSVVLSQKDEVLSTTSENIPSPTLTPTVTPSPIPTSLPTHIPTPTEIPTPTRVITAPADLEPLFDEFSKNFNVDKYKLKIIADCESHFNRGVWKDPYAGMYQFSETTWVKYRNMMGKDPNANLRFGARESIETAAYVLSIGGEHIWPVCSK